MSYDPIILNRNFSIQYHAECFEKMCHIIGNYAYKYIFSFVDLCAKVKHNAQGIIDLEIGTGDMIKLAGELAGIANAYSLPLFACSEPVDLTQWGIPPAACIDPQMVENIIGTPINARKDANQRSYCGCTL